MNHPAKLLPNTTTNSSGILKERGHVLDLARRPGVTLRLLPPRVPRWISRDPWNLAGPPARPLPGAEDGGPLLDVDVLLCGGSDPVGGRGSCLFTFSRLEAVGGHCGTGGEAARPLGLRLGGPRGGPGGLGRRRPLLVVIDVPVGRYKSYSMNLKISNTSSG